MLGLSMQPHSQGTQLDRTCWQQQGLWETGGGGGETPVLGLPSPP